MSTGSGPSIKSGVMRQYHCNRTTEVTVLCQIKGDTIGSWRLWDRTSDGCFVLGRWVITGKTGFVAPLCNADGTPPAPAPPAPGHSHHMAPWCCKGINDAGIALIKEYAPFASNPVNDYAGRLKIGYGHVCHIRCKPSLAPEAAETLLLEDIPEHAACLCAALDHPTFNCNEWAALVSWTHDIGCGNTNDSVLVARLNAGESTSAVPQTELPKWNKGGSIEVPALSARRAAEVKLAMTCADKAMPTLNQTAYPQCGCSL
ncbi:hypothetical protein CspeluHIS016_0602770 [Cutaneotrichosporon spelunceum]|uniref:Lysozyme n=1 Tax=Cutaneotrichosporon spelunceum TaxID=1672016 RepID=A0AAD3YD56_9TREE|nr:hypothetical protein CspeluHIS016_0602770 [Cutaneotrichosporon spelunceum]